MPSQEYIDFIAPFRSRAAFGPEQSIDELRTSFEALAERFFVTPDGVELTAEIIGGVPCEWSAPLDCDDEGLVLYLHGGGYGIGSLNTHRALTGNIAIAAGVRGLLLDYRLAPEHPFPAAIDDAMAVYEALLARGEDPARIILAGDSAGGGMALAMLFTIRDRGLASPAGAICLSPLTDLTHSGASIKDRAARDPFVSEAGSTAYAHRYLGTDGDARDPLASPLFGDFHDLPPVLILVGSEEVLHDDSTAVAAKLEAAGNGGSFEIWDDMVHVWPMFHEHYPEAREGVARVARFVRDLGTGRTK